MMSLNIISHPWKEDPSLLFHPTPPGVLTDLKFAVKKCSTYKNRGICNSDGYRHLARRNELHVGYYRSTLLYIGGAVYLFSRMSWRGINFFLSIPGHFRSWSFSVILPSYEVWTPRRTSRNEEWYYTKFRFFPEHWRYRPCWSTDAASRKPSAWLWCCPSRMFESAWHSKRRRLCSSR